MELQAPEVSDGFNKFEVKGKTIYVQKRIQTVNSGLTFKMRKIFFIREIVVEGIRSNGM